MIVWGVEVRQQKESKGMLRDDYTRKNAFDSNNLGTERTDNVSHYLTTKHNTILKI